MRTEVGRPGKRLGTGYFAGHNPQVPLLSELGPELRPRIQDALKGDLSYLDHVGHGGAAQKSYASTGLMPKLLDVYHLFGDPATRIH